VRDQSPQAAQGSGRSLAFAIAIEGAQVLCATLADAVPERLCGFAAARVPPDPAIDVLEKRVVVTRWTERSLDVTERADHPPGARGIEGGAPHDLEPDAHPSQEDARVMDRFGVAAARLAQLTCELLPHRLEDSRDRRDHRIVGLHRRTTGDPSARLTESQPPRSSNNE